MLMLVICVMLVALPILVRCVVYGGIAMQCYSYYSGTLYINVFYSAFLQDYVIIGLNVTI